MVYAAWGTQRRTTALSASHTIHEAVIVAASSCGAARDIGLISATAIYADTPGAGDLSACT